MLDALAAEELLTAAIAQSSEQVLRSLRAALLVRGGARSRLATDATIQGQGAASGRQTKCAFGNRT